MINEKVISSECMWLIERGLLGEYVPGKAIDLSDSITHELTRKMSLEVLKIFEEIGF